LYRVHLHDNSADRGGGISVQGNAKDPGAVRLWLEPGTVIDSNLAKDAGGGAFCANASVRVWIDSRISYNYADTGGGIRAENCRLEVASAGLYPLAAAVSYNRAAHNGGGISVSGERSVLDLYTVRPDAPTAIVANTAGGVGGGLDIGSSAKVRAFDIVIANNVAGAGGGAVSVFDNDGDTGDWQGKDAAVFEMRGVLEDAPVAAVNCNRSLRCNRISGNAALSAEGEPQPAAALRVYSGADALSSSWGRAEARLNGTTLVDNDGESLLRVYSPGYGSPRVDLAGTALLDNRVTGPLLHNPDSDWLSGARGELYIEDTTMAGNAIGAGYVMRIAGESGFQLGRSIVWQPERQMLSVIGGSVDPYAVRNVLSNDFSGVPMDDSLSSEDPAFVDPAQGNYHLRLESPAVDYAFSSVPTTQWPNENEADRRTRRVDLTVPDRFGPRDLGAYERPQRPPGDY
jgi:predicted outer membrane repeat protein